MILLDNSKNFYKAQLHCHSTNSDGTIPVEKQKEMFKSKGYSVVAFTDHEHLIDNSQLDDKDFLTITSCELAIKEFPERSSLKCLDMRVCHLNLYALDQHNTVTPCYNSAYDHFVNDKTRHLIRHDGEYDREYSGKGITEIIKSAKAQGFLVSYNHPDWSLEDARDYLEYQGLDFVEVYNHSCAFNGGESYNIQALDHFLRSGKRIFATMSDDSHEEKTMFGGWVMINAGCLQYSEIMNALKNGDFYCTQGPEIYSLERRDNRVTVNTSPAVRIGYSSNTRSTEAVNGENITKGEFKIKDSDKYFRITVTDKQGKKAHTQAYFL